jgi:hypothetical protein
MPIPKLATASHRKLRAPAISARNTAEPSSRQTTSRRRSLVSPRGTKSSIPDAVPTCVNIATNPT